MRIAVVLLALFLSCLILLPAQAPKDDQLAPYYPTPQAVVDKMLQLGGLKAGDLINTEVEGKYAGYIAQALQPISLGAKPKELDAIFTATKLIFDRMLKFLKPGVKFGEVVDFYQEQVKAAGYEPDGAQSFGNPLFRRAPGAT